MRSSLVVRNVTPEIEAEYVSNGSSYAICANSPLSVKTTVTRKKRTEKQIAALMNRERVFVPLLLRSVSLVEVYWLNTRKIVLGGVAFESICHACNKKISCTMKGVGNDTKFECTIKAKDLVTISRKAK